MIYKFIDNNGSEITVNSLSSLQALVDSETIKKNTKVKAGLRGKWTTAEKISDLVFEEKIDEQISEETIEPEKDIRSIIIQSKSPEIEEEKKLKNKDREEQIEEVANVEDADEEIEVQDQKKENDEDENVDTSDYYTEKFGKTDDENSDSDYSVSFKDSWKICLSKLTDFSGRASRSEYWKFYISFFILYLTLMFGVLVFIVIANPNISDASLDVISWVMSIPGGLLTLSATVRRLHDTNKSGWYVLIFLIPLIGLIVFVFLILPGDNKKNKYGHNPLK
tara:strand:+ start:76 stop:912 length:837 start_codon:yes stop_codon:yes gene_type:complete